MPSKNFLLLSLEDKEIKKVSNVISNDSCRRILDFLLTKEATESELAEKLQMPISTVHYNLKQLIETGLIIVDEFHYSKKGKEVNHYRLANKYIIIAPKSTFGIKEKLKNILPIALIVSGVAGLIQLFNYFSDRSFMAAKYAEIETSKTAATKAAYLFPQNFALWFLIGALFALIIYFAISLRKNPN